MNFPGEQLLTLLAESKGEPQSYQHIIKQSMIFLLMCICMPCSSLFRLSNYHTDQLTSNDTLVSTLGLFTLQLNSSQCQLVVKGFVESTGYKPVLNTNYMPGQNVGDCGALILDPANGRLITDQNKTYLTVGGPCHELTFSIDDTALIRLICLSNESLTQEYVIKQFYTPQPLLFSYSSGVVTQNSTSAIYTNNGGWQFYAVNQTLTIRNSADSKQNSTYTYNGFTFTPNKIMDCFNNRFPFLTLWKIGLKPKCQPTPRNKVYAPFLFVIDNYWPVFKILDHSGYPIFTFNYPDTDCITLGQSQSPTDTCQLWVCPPQLLEFNGTCVSVCPQHYYHAFNNDIKRCVLNCEQGALIDQNNRICTCHVSAATNCTLPSFPRAFGCQCDNSLYYDGYGCVSRKIALIQECTYGFIAYNGICISCPMYCKTCVLSNNNILFLQCNICFDNYILNYKGLCQLSCNPLLGQTPSIINNNTCQNCKDQNCVNCQYDVNYCMSCNSITILWSGICIQRCLSTDVVMYTPHYNFYCLTVSTDNLCKSVSTNYFQYYSFLKCMECVFGYAYQEKCVPDCTFVSLNLVGDIDNKVCKCKSANDTLVGNQCRNIPTCPLKMYYNSSQFACLTCPYGCLTCVGRGNRRICVSCPNSFILFAANEMPTCVQNSLVLTFTNDTYLLNNILLPKIQNSSYNQCLGLILGCVHCLKDSADICILCSPNLYLISNKCVTKCPKQTFAHGDVCLLNNVNDPSCQNFGIKVLYSFASITRDNVSDNSAYSYYTYNLTNAKNIPLGYQLLNQKVTFNQSVQSPFPEIRYFCKTCKDGYSTSQAGTDVGVCLPCLYPCVTCLKLDPTWCLSCPQGYTIRQGRVCTQVLFLCHEGQYRDVNLNCLDSCHSFYLNMPVNKIINCSTSCPPNTAPQLRSNGKGLECVDSNVKSFTKLRSAVFFSNSKIKIYFFPDSSFANVSKIKGIQISMISGSNTRLLRTAKISARPEYILVTLDKLPISAFIINFTNCLLATVTVKGTYLINSIYGIDFEQGQFDYVHRGYYIVAVIVSSMLVCLHVIYIGNRMLYTLDNTIIFGQSIFYFMFLKDWNSSQVIQFCYGFGLLHFQFFFNLFNVFMPDNYHEEAPLAYMLINQDANILRNAGFTLSCLIATLFVFILVAAVLHTIKRYLYKQQAWNIKIWSQCVYAIIEMSIMNVCYFSLTELYYCKVVKGGFYLGSLLTAMVALLCILVYAVYRMYFHRIAGMYCFKRILIALILSYSHNNNYCYLLFLLEGMFVVARIILEEPYTSRELFRLYSEQLLIQLGYTILIFSPYLQITIASVFSILVYFIMVHVNGLTTLYLIQHTRYKDQVDNHVQKNEQY